SESGAVPPSPQGLPRRMTSPVPLTRRDAALAGLLALTMLAAGLWRLVPGVCGVFHDDAIYVLTAKALADGEGYRIVSLPEAPPQTKYPVLYPAVLSLIWLAWPAFPDNLVAMQGLTLLCACAFVALAYLYLVRFGY